MCAARSGSAPPTLTNRLRNSTSLAALMSILADSSVALAVSVVSPSFQVCAWPSRFQVSAEAVRESSNTVRSMAPLAAARACAIEIMLRAAIASLRIENAKPLAITVSMTVSHSARMSAMPRCRREGRARRMIMPWRSACALRPNLGILPREPRAAQ